MADTLSLIQNEYNPVDKLAQLERRIALLEARDVYAGDLSQLSSDMGEITAGLMRGVSPIVNYVLEDDVVEVEETFAYITGPDLMLDGVLMLDGDIVLIG